VAHRALASREDHHRLLRRQPRHPLRHRRRLLGFLLAPATIIIELARRRWSLISAVC
jgi:hypothetical protein